MLNPPPPRAGPAAEGAGEGVQPGHKDLGGAGGHHGEDPPVRGRHRALWGPGRPEAGGQRTEAGAAHCWLASGSIPPTKPGKCIQRGGEFGHMSGGQKFGWPEIVFLSDLKYFLLITYCTTNFCGKQIFTYAQSPRDFFYCNCNNACSC